MSLKKKRGRGLSKAYNNYSSPPSLCDADKADPVSICLFYSVYLFIWR